MGVKVVGAASERSTLAATLNTVPRRASPRCGSDRLFGCECVFLVVRRAWTSSRKSWKGLAAHFIRCGLRGIYE